MALAKVLKNAEQAVMRLGALSGGELGFFTPVSSVLSVLLGRAEPQLVVQRSLARTPEALLSQGTNLITLSLPC